MGVCTSCFLAAVALVICSTLAPNAAATAPWLARRTLPQPNYLSGTGVFGRQLQAAISATGASQQQQAQLASDLHNHIYRTWHSMANVHRCCTRADLRMGAAHNFQSYTAMCGSVSRLQPGLEYAHAQAGPTNVNCSSALEELVYQITVLEGRQMLGQTLMELYGPDAWNITMLARVLKDNAFPQEAASARGSAQTGAGGYSYAQVLHAIESTNFLGETAYEKAVVIGCFGEAGRANASYALKWVLRDSMAIFLLIDLFVQLAAVQGFHTCSNLGGWFREDNGLTSKGRACREASRALPCALWNSTHCPVDSFIDNRAQRWQGAADRRAAAAPTFTWLRLFVREAVALLVLALCWRPDLLVWWRQKPDVHAPSLSTFTRNVKQQRSLARLARQAAAQAPHGSGSSPSRLATQAARLSPTPSLHPVGRVADYALHLLRHCWLPRARFAVASYAQLPLFVLSLPARLGVAVWRSCKGLVKAAASSGRAMMV